MKCHISIKQLLRNSLLLCLLLGSIVHQAYGKGPGTVNFDKVLNKEDLDTIILVIGNEINDPAAKNHYHEYTQPILAARDDFFMENKGGHISHHANKMAENLENFYASIVNSTICVSVKDKTLKLHAKLIDLLHILQKYVNSDPSLGNVASLGCKLKKHEHLLPKRLNTGILALGALLKKRLKR